MTSLGLREPPPGPPFGDASYADLVRVIRRVRSRWRTRRLLLGLAALVAAAAAVLGISSAGLDALRYEPWAVRGLSAAVWLLAAGAVWRFLWRPLRSKVSDEQVALYIEEHDPTLCEAVVSGVELGKRVGGPDGAAEGADVRGISPELTRLVIVDAAKHLETLGAGKLVEKSGLRRAGGALAGMAGAAVVLSLLAPEGIRRGASLLLTPWADIAAANPYRVFVEPEGAAVAVGADRWIEARLEGFTAERVDLRTRGGAAAAWESTPMVLDPESGTFRRLLVGIPEATDYFVDAEGVRSPVFRIEVEHVPQVSRISLRYRYPAHTGLSPREVEDGGDIAAVAGTMVDLTVWPTLSGVTGALRREPGARETALTPERDSSGAAARLTASLGIDTSGSYRIALAGPDGVLRTASRDYAIEVLEDLPPLVRFLRPGRDLQASPVEEVFTEVQAEDDYAVDRLEIRLSVNGGEEKRVVLASGGARETVQSGHTLFLEEEELAPGDLVSYYAFAADGAGAESSTDLFFVAIRPFDRTYRQADSLPGGAGGAGDGLDGTLTLRQRQVVVATFKVLRDREELPAAVLSETVATIGLAQGRLGEQVGTLTRRLRNRGIEASAEFGQILEHLDAGLVEMGAAEELLIGGDPETALPHEQKALTHLQRADAVFREVQVAFSQGGGGGGGSPRPQAEDLADLFELEMDKLRNQYETVEQQRRSSADDEVDEVLERLAELARRQEQENERRRRSSRPPGSGSGSAQGRLAEETEDVARRLERLARERSRPDLAALSRRLRTAADQMRAAGGESGLSSGLSAANSLRSARRDLDGQRRERLDRDVADAAGEARRLRQAQERIRSQVKDLETERSPEAVSRVSGQKEELVNRVKDLELRLDEVSRDWSGDEPEASRAVGQAAAGIRNRKLKEKIHYSRGVAAQRSPEYADQFEAMIEDDIRSLEEELTAALEVVRGSERGGREQVLDRAAGLLRGLEAMRNRLADRSGRPTPENGGAAEESGSDAAETRQLDRELGRRIEDVEALRQAMTGIGAGREGAAERLDQVASSLRGLNPERLAGDPRGMEILEAEVLDTLRQLEFELRRTLAETEGSEVLTGASEHVPEGYREMVEEYFRNLSRRPAGR